MNLENITVTLRPRSSWEAIDIGFSLTRRWFWKLWLLWVLIAAPSLLLMISISLLLPGLTSGWTLLLFWFCKPFYEPPLLNWISNALFGGKSTINKTLKDYRKNLGFKRSISILLSRLSPFRSFVLPLLLLEGLESKDLKSRSSLLKEGNETAILVTIIGFFLEFFLAFSLMNILFWLTPEELHWVDFGDFIFQPGGWLLLFSYFIGCSLFTPFYICSGFMMYISRRVELEAWDIEIGFKRIQQRLERKENRAASIIRVTLLFFFLIGPLEPECSYGTKLNPELARSTITSVLEEKEFGQKITKYHWVPKEKEIHKADSKWGEIFAQFLESLGKSLEGVTASIARYSEFLLWCCSGALITFFLIKYSKSREWIGNHFIKTTNEHTPPEVMFGMNLRPESMPEDIPAACIALLDEGKQREAISLLYRGTLSNLVNQHQLEIQTSFTENACCFEVEKTRPEPEANFFANLTSLWVFLAYGHLPPKPGSCRELVHCWEGLYGAKS